MKIWTESSIRLLLKSKTAFAMIQGALSIIEQTGISDDAMAIKVAKNKLDSFYTTWRLGQSTADLLPDAAPPWLDVLLIGIDDVVIGRQVIVKSDFISTNMN